MPSVIPSAREIAKGAITTLIVAAVLAAGGALLGVLDEQVPLWLVVAAVLLIPIAAIAGQVSEAGESLEPFYVDHIGEILNTLQNVFAGKIPGVTVDQFIEQGILAPAKQWLTSSGKEDIRLSILEPHGDRFAMVAESGHSVEAKQNFDLEVQGSFAGFALGTGEMQWTNDVDADPRWRRHPKARPGREYGSLASVPIRVGDQVVGVFNVLSTRKNAFLPSELMYIDVLGSIINVVWSFASAQDSGQDREDLDDQTPG